MIKIKCPIEFFASIYLKAISSGRFPKHLRLHSKNVIQIMIS